MTLHGYAAEFYERVQRSKPPMFDADRHRRRAEARLIASGMPQWARQIVYEEADRHMISPVLVIGKGNRRSGPRHAALYAAMYRIKRAWPTTTIADIGRWFGRDHSTVSYGIAKHAHHFGLPPVNGFAVEAKLRRRIHGTEMVAPARPEDEPVSVDP